MVEVLQRYRTLIIVICIILFGLILWLFISRQYINKIPSRGVFVLNFEKAGYSGRIIEIMGRKVQ